MSDAGVRNANAQGAARSSDYQTQVAEQHLPLVHAVARRFAQRPGYRPYELDDLVAWGVLGLMCALERFDASRGLAFSTFAVPKIRGAILDGIREWVGEPRSAQRKRRTLAHQPPATIPDATRRRWELDALATAAPVPLDVAPESSLVAPVDDRVAPEERALLQRAVDALPPAEAAVVRGIYLRGLRGSDVARELGVSENWVSQLRARGVARLRARLQTTFAG